MWLVEINIIQYSLDMASGKWRDFKSVLQEFVFRIRNGRQLSSAWKESRRKQLNNHIKQNTCLQCLDLLFFEFLF